MTELTASLVEIFDSWQGEGLLAGTRTTFVRLAGCNLSCDYCDTGYAREHPDQCRVIDAAGSERNLANPLRVEQVISLARTFPGGWVSITGGEPLLEPDFVRRLATGLRQQGCRILLETNGTLPRALEQVADSIDLISMDIKLPSTAGEAHWEAHWSFLRVKPESVYVKMVVGPRTPRAEIQKGFELVAEVGEDIPVFLQPVSASGDQLIDPDFYNQLMKWQEEGLLLLNDVRVLPQVHKLLRVR